MGTFGTSPPLLFAARVLLLEEAARGARGAALGAQQQRSEQQTLK